MLRPFFASALTLLCFALFEATILSNIMILPAVPDFLLLCSLFLSYNNGRSFGAAVGFSSGLFLDFLTASPLGLNCMLRTILGWAAGFLNGSLIIERIFLPAVLAFVATILKAFLLRAIAVFFPISVSYYDFSSSVFLSEIIMNTVLSPIMFKFLSIFHKLLIKDDNNVE